MLYLEKILHVFVITITLFVHPARLLRGEENVIAEPAHHLLKMANTKLILGDLPAAMEAAKKAKALGEHIPDRVVLARALASLADIQEASGEYAQAKINYKESLKISQQIKEKNAMSRALQGLANIYLIQRAYAQALEYYRNALAIAEDLDDKAGIAGALVGVGAVHAEQSIYAEAMEYYQRSLNIAEDVGEKVTMALVLNRVGNVLLRQNDYTQGAEYYQRSLNIAEEIQYKRVIADNLKGLGRSYAKQDNYLQAMSYYQKSLELAEAMGDKREIASILDNMGVVYHDQGNYAQAIKSYQKALKIRIGLDDKLGMASTLDNLGALYTNQGDYAHAIRYYQRGLKVAEAIGSKKGAAFILIGLGKAYFAQGRYRSAIEYYNKALEASEGTQAKGQIGRALNGIGYVYVKLKKYRLAIERFQQALEVGDDILEPDLVWEAEAGLGHVYEKLSDRTLALKHYESAIRVIERVRVKAISEEGKVDFLARKADVYSRAAHISYRLHLQDPRSGYDRDAFSYAERSRARAFLDALAEAHIKVRNAVAEEDKKYEHKLLRNISRLQVALRQESTPQQRQKLLAQLKEKEQTLEAFLIRLRATYPQYAQLNYPEPYDALRIQTEVLAGNEVLLEYLLDEERSFLFLVRRGSFQIFTLPKRRVIEDAVRSYRNLLTKSPRDPGAFDQVRNQGQLIYRILFGKVATKIPTGAKLIIIPDGLLHYLPFETLVKTEARSQQPAIDSRRDVQTEYAAGRTAYLIEDYIITYAPSASVLAAVRKESAGRKKEGRKKLLAYGDPVFSIEDGGAISDHDVGFKSNGNERSAGISPGLRDLIEWKFERLDYTKREVESLAQLYRKDQVKIYVGERATESAVKKEALKDYQYIHFATHSVVDEDMPARSGVILSPIGERNEDGILQMREIFGLELNADLVVLSACKTGLGKMVKGEGLVSLTRAFMYAGAESLVVSLWSVSDESTAEFMKSFYGHMKSGESKSQALRRAKLEMIRSTTLAYRLPYFWAAFVLIGSPR